MREVLIAAYDDVQPLDVTGPAQMFDAAARLQRGGYRMRLAIAGRPGGDECPHTWQ
ncbi:hypothetical protein ABZ801_26555 [Actinomadura sp. NPDC047616]|uniref:hypothetical protein n=1 Tax=Actinomadura sp. NPDC047616 TaxID=3155914 RepID=UPI00340CDFCE